MWFEANGYPLQAWFYHIGTILKYFVTNLCFYINSSQPWQKKKKGAYFAWFIFNCGYHHLPEFMWKSFIIVLLRISAEYLESSLYS